MERSKVTQLRNLRSTRAAAKASKPVSVGEASGAKGKPKVRSRRRFLVYLAAAGPGLIAANAGNDAGGVATYASAGSQYGYRTLFFMVLVTVGLVVMQEMAARLGAITGKGLGSLIREEFSIRLTGLAMVCLLLSNVGLVVSEFAGIGAAFGLFGVSRYISVPLAALVIWGLVLFGSYRYAERIFLVLSLAFFAYPIAAILGNPNWHLVLVQTITPHFVYTKDFVFLGVALIGTTISPYMQLYGAAGVVDRGIGPDEYPLERIDAVGGAIFADLISMFIIIATAATIGGSGPLTSAAQAARALKPVAGSGAEILFGLGLLGASALAGAVVPLSTSYVVAETLGVERSVSRKYREAPLFLGLFTAQVVFGALVSLLPVNLINLLIGTQVIQGILTPVILAFILVLANRKAVLGKYVNGPIFRKIALAVVLLIGSLSALLVIQTVLGWFGV
ncbi:MAG: divalent metal cation transporter [Acidimicrobiaceae bacterium]|nr:divalent metal cation transporter [Acidimicrobiaceae bacterium]